MFLGAEDGKMTATIQEVKARQDAPFLGLPGVVSVGIGRGAKSHQVIVIGGDRARPETQARLPAQLEGYPVRVRVEITGTVKA